MESGHIEASVGGIGFVCVAPAVGQAKALPAFARAVLTLLHALSAAPPAANGLDRARLADELSAMSLMGGRRLVRVRLSTDKAKTDKAVAEAVRGHLDGLYNRDLAPTKRAGRTWNAYNIFTLWANDVHSLGNYAFAIGLFALGLGGLDLRELRRRHGMGVRDVEAQPLGGDQRPLLRDMLAQPFAQRGVEQVGGEQRRAALPLATRPAACTTCSR